MIRVCLDSNVLVAAFAARGMCADLLRLVLTEHHLVIPTIVAEELRRVLREELDVSPEALSALEAVLARCEMIPASTEPSPIQVRDPDDEQILADALAGGMQILVTGDTDLLSIADRPPIPILSPRAFITLVRGGAL